MVSRQSAILSLSMVVLMLTLPWTVIADSSSRGGDESSETILVSTNRNTNGYSVDVEVEFVNITAGTQYDYSIWFTRVDPIFPHETMDGNFTSESDRCEINRQWAPDQEGPYTVHVSLSLYGSEIVTATDTFDWGDVANNSHSPVADISVNYEGVAWHSFDGDVGIESVGDWLYLDIYENQSMLENVSIEFDASDGTESGAEYRMDFALYKLGEEESERLLGMNVGSVLAGYTMSNLNGSLGGWVDGADYQFTLTLELVWENRTEVAFSSLNFTIGVPPILWNVGCTDVNATNYDANATVDDDSCEFDTDGDGVLDHLEIEGCTDSDAENYKENATEEDGSCEYKDTDQDGVFDHLEVVGCLDKNATNFDSNATDSDGSCSFSDSDGDGIHDHLEIEGCLDSDATNFNPSATDSGTCTYPEFSVGITSDQTTGMAPLMVSFEADISGGNSPYEVQWNFGDGMTSTRASVSHSFDAGVYMVVLQVTDDDGVMLQESIPIIASGVPSTDELSGYFTDTGQLGPISKGMVATFEFTGVADGGEGPYTFDWEFGDGASGTGELILHEYAKYSEHTVRLTITDSTGESVQLERNIYISPGDDGGDDGISSTSGNDDGGDSNFDIYATGTGAIGLLLIFGLFGRKRRESFLDAERRKAQGEGSIWDEI